MKINKVTLRDYRSYSGEHIFEFSEGINLLLGKNGAGKSSILEAVGLALFGTGNRSGSLGDVINYNAKSCFISVEFEANDGLNYKVERKIGNGAFCRLFTEGDPSPRCENIDAVKAKISELSGIEKNTDNIYKDVVTAYQNKITGIFLDKPAARQDTFNGIFDTEIYRTIYAGFARDVLSKYEQLNLNKSGSLDTLNRMLKDAGELLSVRKQAEESKINVSKELDLVSKQLKILELSEKKLTGLKNDIQITNKNLENLTVQKDNNIKNLDDIGKLLKNSVDAKKIVNDNQTDFEDYNRLLEIQTKLRTEINKLEKDEQLKNDFIQLKSNYEKQSEIGKTEIIGYQNNINEKNDSIQKLKDELNILQNKLDDENNHTNNLFNELNNYINAKSQFDIIYNQYNLFIEKEKDLKKSIKEITETLPDFNKLDENEKHLEHHKSELYNRLADMRLVEAEINKYHTRLKDNDEADKVLSDGICPYLKEECLNISGGSNAADYFARKKSELTAGLLAQKELLKNYDSLDVDLRKTEELLTFAKKAKEDGKAAQECIASKNSALQLCIKDKELCKKNIQLCLINYEQDLPGFADAADFKFAENYLIEIIASKNAEYKQANDNVTKTNNDLQKLNKEITESNDAVFKMEADIKSKESEKVRLKNEIDKLEEQVTELKTKTDLLPGKKTQIAEIDIRLAVLKPSYDVYMSNKKASEEIDFHQSRMDSITKILAELDTSIAEFSLKLSDLSSKFSMEELDRIITAKTEKSEHKENLISNLSLARSTLQSAQEDIDKNQKVSADIEQLKSQMAHTSRKIELTKKLRDNLNEMGKHVATRLLSKIEYLATENYRRISGKTEQIKWLNDNSNSYLVCLDNGTFSRKFDQLSGGEQVTVAIAIRSAMASVLTKARFAIFDEPTNNLDSERRSALSESLQDMFRDLKQAIIVTHDDTFREMANRIIAVNS